MGGGRKRWEEDWEPADVGEERTGDEDLDFGKEAGRRIPD